MELTRIGIIGGGNMGRALIGGLLESALPQSSIRVGEPEAECRAGLAGDFGVLATADNRAAVQGCQLVILAVKPQAVAAVLEQLRPALEPTRPVLLSVVAGIRVAALETRCGADVPVVRAMPNRPALVGAGITGLYAPQKVTGPQREMAGGVMAAVGATVWVRAEEELDAVTALSGSGPAYLFLLAELMAEAGVQQGLAPGTARQLAVETLHGAGALIHAGGDLARARQDVASPGGTTEAALAVFGAEGLAAMVGRAMQAAAARSRELAAQFGAG